MFEEIIVWDRVDDCYAIRYFGLRNLKTGLVWIGFANHLGLDDSRDIEADEVVSGQATLQTVLADLPNSSDEWKPTTIEAMENFIARQAAEMDRSTTV